MNETDRMLERVKLEKLTQDLPIEDTREILSLVSQFKDFARFSEIEFQSMALLVFLYKNNLILKQKEMNEKE